MDWYSESNCRQINTAKRLKYGKTPIFLAPAMYNPTNLLSKMSYSFFETKYFRWMLFTVAIGALPILMRLSIVFDNRHDSIESGLEELEL